jgi:2-polyprenyl-3-methyl-5-hydroxy-6-metoxy-1,4-benzoquinol methylase
MNEYNEKWFNYYSELAQKTDNLTVASGRFLQDASKEKDIWEDIIFKLDLQPQDSILDIGCGFSNVSTNLARFACKNNSPLTLMDFPNVIDALTKHLELTQVTSKIKFIKGVFPEDFPKNTIKKEQFDKILTYSVVQCTNDPFNFIEKAIQFLKPNGKLLVGDLPNVNKKGRFLASKAGKAFDAAYKNKEIAEIPTYKSHREFVEKNGSTHNIEINDMLIQKIIKKYRNKGYDVYILPQPIALPFSKTREDLVICRHD